MKPKLIFVGIIFLLFALLSLIDAKAEENNSLQSQENTTVIPLVPKNKTEPGAEAVIAIAGLLAVAFLVLRQKK